MIRPALQVRNVHAGYGEIDVVRGIDIDVGHGEAVGLFGPNGHGKTTLFRVISGLVSARQGEIVAFGTDITNASPRKVVAQGIVHVPQAGVLFPRLSVEENLRLGAFRSPAWRKRDDAMADIYERFPPLAQRHRQEARTLSGGERQMLAVGMGLMARPRLLILDEPTLGLAPHVRRELASGLASVIESGLAVLVVDQDIELLRALTSRLCLIEEGQVRAQIGRDTDLSESEVMNLYFGGARQ